MTSKIYKLDFDLVKQLAGAGFPKPIFINETSGYREFGNEPDLSELIEACGECDFRLEQNPLADVLWTATVDIHHFVGEGKTPEEAVARLWLALQD